MNKDGIQNIYEIYRACRLCGAGAGYKMPIIQSVIDLQGEDIELHQKIRECVQIEVKHNDRMPPLICELCVDKINDFFEFRRICQETNKNTRLRLGLPQESLPQTPANASVEHSIPGAMETVYVNSDSDEEEPLSKRQSTPAVKSKPKPKSAKLKEEVKIEVESTQSTQKEKERLPTPEMLEGRRETRGKRPPSPKRATRQSFSDDSTYLSDQQDEENSLLVLRPKRSREVTLEFPPPAKKSRLAFEPPLPVNFVKPGPKSSKVAQKPTPQTQEKPLRSGPKSRTVDLSPTLSPSLNKNEKTPTQNYSKELLALLGEKIPAPNSKKPEGAPSPGPKSKKQEVAPSPGPKSKRPELAPSPGPKSKKPEVAPSPGPKSKKVDVRPSPGPKSRKPEVRPSPEPKSSEVPSGPKFTKELLSLYDQKLLGPKSIPPEVSPKPVPRKPQRTTTETALRRYQGPKSKKVELSPVVEPTSNKRDLTPVSGPKSKKREVTPVPGPKSRRGDVTPSVELKLKQAESSPASNTKTKRRELSPSPSPQPERKALPAPPKTFDCCVCDFKTKHANALTAHLKSHTPQFTPIKQACNPCELWFSSADEASWHHRRHTNKSMPYTCTKCYDDFRTMQDYQLHFTRNQCLPTYEVPDVKCDDCWRYFPTYKLLEDHKCPGEGGRPGGKCSKCSRTYSLLKYQIAHELKCSFKKKGEPIVDPEVSSRLLPMQVRIVKCDLILKPASDDRYDVSELSNKFGLDRHCNYPYLNSMDNIRVKTESQVNQFDNMVSVKAEVKEESQKDDGNVFDSGDSDGETVVKEETFLNLLANDDPVDTLSTMSLNTIMAPKCLETISGKKQKMKDEKDSIMNNDLKSNISNIIDSLRTEAHARDSCDSDSILDKSQSLKAVSSPALDVFDSPVTKSINSNTEENTGDSTESDKINSDKISKETANDNVKQIKIEVEIEMDTLNNSNNDQITENRNDRRDGQENEDASNIMKDADSKLHDGNDSAPVKSDDASEVTQDATSKHSNNVSNKSTIDPKNGQVVSNKVANQMESSHIEDKGDITLQSEESEKVDVEHSEQPSADTDVSLPLLENRTETIGDQTDRSSPINHKNKIDTDSGKEDSQSSDVIDSKAINDLNSAENDESQSSFVTNYKADSDNTVIDSENNTADTLIDTVDKNDENVAESIDAQNSTETKSERIDKGMIRADKFHINNLNADDKVLMAKLDAHIAEEESKSDAIGGKIIQGGVIGGTVDTNAVIGRSEVHSAAIGSKGHSATFDASNSPSVVNDVGFDDCDEKKESLNEMRRKRDADLRSLDLDSISDEEFNFDI